MHRYGFTDTAALINALARPAHAIRVHHPATPITTAGMIHQPAI